MRKFIPTILILSTLAGVFAPISPYLGKGSVSIKVNETKAETFKTGEFDYTDPYAEINAGQDCNFGFGALATCLEYIFYYVPYYLGTQALFWSAKLFDAFAAITLSSKIYSESDFIRQGWQITRDFSNVFFLLILLYIALSLILGLEIGHANPKKMLASVILVAIFINFSLFFTQVIIDTSNVLALVFYNQIQVTSEKNSAKFEYSNKKQKSVSDASNALGVEVKPISEAIVQAFTPQFLYSKTFYQNITVQVEKEYSFTKLGAGLLAGALVPVAGWATIAVGGIVGGVSDAYTYFSRPAEKVNPLIFIPLLLIIGSMLFVAAYAFFVSALSFVGRIIELWIAMIFAPFAFVSTIIPATEHLPNFGWKDWLQRLFSAAFAAPIFFFFLLLITLMTHTTIAGPDFFKNASSYTVLFALLIPFLIIIVLLLKATKYVKSASGELGAMFANAGVGLAKLIGGFALGTAAGYVALGGRATVGAVSNRLRTQNRLDLAGGVVTENLRKELANKRDWRGRKFDKFLTMDEKDMVKDKDFLGLSKDARRDIGKLDKLATMSFDARHTALGNKLSSATGMNLGSFEWMGTASTQTYGGFDGAVARDAGKARKLAERLSYNHDRVSNLKNFIDDRDDQINLIERELKDLREDQRTLNRPNSGATQQEIDDLKDKIKSKQQQVEALKSNDRRVFYGAWKQEDVGNDCYDPTLGQPELLANGNRNPAAHRVIRADEVGKLKDPAIGITQADVTSGYTFADGQKATAADIGKKVKNEFLGLNGLKNQVEVIEKSRMRGMYHQMMLNTGYAVHGEKWGRFGDIRENGHIDLKHEGVKQYKNILRESLGYAIAGAGAGMMLGPAGLAGLALSGKMAATLGGIKFGLDGLREAVGNLDHHITDITGRTRQSETAMLAANMSHQIHEIHHKVMYHPPASDFFAIFKSAGGGGGHGGGGGGHGGGGHGGGHGGH